MSSSGAPGADDGLDRQAVLRMLAAFGDRAPREVRDEIGSLELTWLIAQFEERYSVTVELDDQLLARIQTVADATDALRDVLGLGPIVPGDAAALPMDRAELAEAEQG